MIVASDDDFFLVRSGRRGATHKLLFYTLPARGFCKVDILIPGTMNIPSVPRSRITYTRVPDVPVMPLIAVLLLKLQGWTHHRDADRQDYQEKQHVDVEDIMEMLEIARRDYATKTLESERWMPREFVDSAADRVGEFIESFPATSEYWYEIGFDVWT